MFLHLADSDEIRRSQLNELCCLSVRRPCKNGYLVCDLPTFGGFLVTCLWRSFIIYAASFTGEKSEILDRSFSSHERVTR